MEDTMRTEPVFAPEAQETFVVGERIYAPVTGVEGTYLGWDGDDPHAPAGAFVEWDNHKSDAMPTWISRESFSDIKNLYR